MSAGDGNDVRIRDYVRRRLMYEVPPDLVASIHREVDQTPQRRRPSVAWPVYLAGVVAGGALIAAVLLWSGPADDIGATPTPVPSATASPGRGSPTPSPGATPGVTAEPTSTPTATASPTPSDAYGPAHQLEPEDAFSEPDECENGTAGYRISMPDDWFFNTEFDGFDACQWFAPTTYTVTDAATIPDEVAIVLSVQEGGDFGPGGEVVQRDEYTVAGRPAVRYEVAGEPGGFAPERSVIWTIGIDGELPSENATGNWLMARTGTDRGGDLDESIDVLDRMIATLELFE